MIREYDVVRLKKDIPSSRLAAGARGTVLIVYNEPSLPRGYEVEFLDGEGGTIAVLTLQDEDIEEISGSSLSNLS